ncbi:MAG TPA: universal stress protein [Streptosporangiaceae bacterium]
MTGPGAEGGHWPGWAGQHEAAGPRGSLRIYLGFAPGAGATCALLNEGGQWAERGADVVIACADTRGRPYTAGLLAGLPERAVPLGPGPAPAAVPLDVGRVLARAPQIALVDDLAQVNPAGSAHPARWHDVEELLAAGIDVIATVRLASLESLSDVAETITGESAGDTVPDGVVRAADEIELVDATPEVLRERMARGEIYPLPQAHLALAGPFRAGNLSALRELALLWLATKLAEDPQRHRPGGCRGRTGQARERVVAGVSGGPGSPALIRRAARLAARSSGELLAVHVVRPGRRADGDPATLTTLRRLTESLGGTFQQVTGDDIAEALVTVARAEGASELVLGAPRHLRLAALRPRASITGQTLRRCTGLDVHIVCDRSTRDDKKPGRQLPRRSTSARNALIPARAFTALTGRLARVRETLSTLGGVPPTPVSRQHLP